MVAIFCAPVQAMVYVPMEDGTLFDRAGLVVEGTVESAQAVPGRELDERSYRIRVTETYKGLAAATLDVVAMGALDGNAEGARVVPGSPEFEAGESVLLFLDQRRDGALTVSQASLGAFHLRGDAALRELPEPMDSAKAADADGAREITSFRHWLRERAAGRTAPEALRVAAPPVAKFSLGQTLARWFDFGQGRTVTFYAGSTGQPGLAGGGYSQFQQALQAWNADGGSDIRFVYGGTSTSIAGLGRPDSMNVILFDDPNDEVPGSFDCTRGGIVAWTSWRSSGSGLLGGILFQSIRESDIVVQDGAGCSLAGGGGSTAAEVFAHELGHAVGLGHSCGELLSPCTAGSAKDQAIMRASVHGDGRGAALQPDDRAGAAYLYPSGTPVTKDPPPAAETATQGGGGGGSLSPMGLLLMALAACGWGRRRGARMIRAPRNPRGSKNKGIWPSNPDASRARITPFHVPRSPRERCAPSTP